MKNAKILCFNSSKKAIIDNVVFILYNFVQRVTMVMRLFKHKETVAEFQTTICQCLWVKETTRLYPMYRGKSCCITNFDIMGQLSCNLLRYYLLNWHFESWICVFWQSSNIIKLASRRIQSLKFLNRNKINILLLDRLLTRRFPLNLP